MTFKDLQKLIQSENPEDNQQLQRLRDKPFWYWDQTMHKDKHRTYKGSCCFNHIIGLPRKDGIEKPIFDYEGMLYDALLRPGYLNSRPASPAKSIEPNNVAYPFKLKHFWVKKATGLLSLCLGSWLGFVCATMIIEIVRWLLSRDQTGTSQRNSSSE